MKWKLALSAVLSCLLVPQHAWAAINALEQLRQVVAGGSVTTVDENVTFYEARPAEFFGAFEDSVGLALRTEFGSATADAFTRQVSTIYANEISMFGTADSFAFAPSGEDTAYANSVSQFSVRFELTTPGKFRVTASGFAQNAATSTMTLHDGEGLELVGFDAQTTAPIDVVLDLPAGEYSLGATADSSGYIEFGAGQPDGRSEINMLFTPVPEPSTGLLGLMSIAAACALRMRFNKRA